MKKPLLQSVFVLLLALAAGSAFAQIAPKAYAPENLRTLSVQDQTRVISLEYSEQSRGRRIPDDQLRFYLDQVNRSNWSFSRIKQDIAQSLGGNSGAGTLTRPPMDRPSCARARAATPGAARRRGVASRGWYDRSPTAAAKRVRPGARRMA